MSGRMRVGNSHSSVTAMVPGIDIALARCAGPSLMLNPEQHVPRAAAVPQQGTRDACCVEAPPLNLRSRCRRARRSGTDRTIVRHT